MNEICMKQVLMNYLKHLIDSLRKSKGIESSLVIFSHDLYHEGINALVQSIDSFPVGMTVYRYIYQRLKVQRSIGKNRVIPPAKKFLEPSLIWHLLPFYFCLGTK